MPNCMDTGYRIIRTEPECPQCVRFREKLDREKMARLLCALACAPLGTQTPEEYWEPVSELVREIWRSHAEALIAYLTE